MTKALKMTAIVPVLLLGLVSSVYFVFAETNEPVTEVTAETVIEEVIPPDTATSSEETNLDAEIPTETEIPEVASSTLATTTASTTETTFDPKIEQTPATTTASTTPDLELEATSTPEIVLTPEETPIPAIIEIPEEFTSLVPYTSRDCLGGGFRLFLFSNPGECLRAIGE